MALNKVGKLVLWCVLLLAKSCSTPATIVTIWVVMCAGGAGGGGNGGLWHCAACHTAEWCLGHHGTRLPFP